MSVDKAHVYEINVVHLNSGRFREYIKNLPEIVKIMEAETSCRFLGQYWVEAGGAPQCITIMRWEGLEKRSNEYVALMKNESFLKLRAEMTHAVHHAENYMCYNYTFMPYSAPDTVSNNKIWFAKYRLCDDPMDAAEKWTGEYKHWQEQEPNLPRCFGLFSPIFFTEPCMIAMFEVPEGTLDNAMHAIPRLAADRANRDRMHSLWKNVQPASMRLLTPIGRMMEFLH